MKADTHPTYFPKATVQCACGNTFTVGSTREKMSVEICSACHPFYTGNEKILDTAGRVEKFRARSAFAKAQAHKRAAGKAAKNKGARAASKGKKNN